VLNQYWVLTAYTVIDQDHDDGYLRQTEMKVGFESQRMDAINSANTNGLLFVNGWLAEYDL